MQWSTPAGGILFLLLPICQHEPFVIYLLPPPRLMSLKHREQRAEPLRTFWLCFVSHLTIVPWVQQVNFAVYCSSVSPAQKNNSLLPILHPAPVNTRARDEVREAAKNKNTASVLMETTVFLHSAIIIIFCQRAQSWFFVFLSSCCIKPRIINNMLCAAY